MLKHYENAKQRWGGSHSLIDLWLKKRERLIVKYYNVLSSKPLDSKKNELAESMSIFCEALMNYCSVSHFQVYEKLLTETQELAPQKLQFARDAFPKLEKITEKLVDFNDQYDSQCSLDEMMQLSESLSKLGELLEDRFLLEDELIENLHSTEQIL